MVPAGEEEEEEGTDYIYSTMLERQDDGSWFTFHCLNETMFLLEADVVMERLVLLRRSRIDFLTIAFLI